MQPDMMLAYRAVISPVASPTTSKPENHHVGAMQPDMMLAYRAVISPVASPTTHNPQPTSGRGDGRKGQASNKDTAPSHRPYQSVAHKNRAPCPRSLLAI